MKALLQALRSADKQERFTWFGLLMGIFVSSAVFGFIYETIFYYFNDHMLLRRGTTFLPLIQLYGWGGLLIFLVAYDLRKSPWKVLLTSGVVCGLLEFITGYLLYHLGDGYRGWDYNTEIWNWGNIGGYVCFRSVAFFAVSGLLLMYVIIPLLQRLVSFVGPQRFFTIMVVVTAIILLDIAYNDIIANYGHLPDARQFYAQLGWPNTPTN